MRFVSVFLIPVIILVVYKLAQSIAPGKSTEYTIITLLLGVIGWLTKFVFTLEAEKGSSKAQLDTIKEEKAELKQRIRELEQQNSEFKAQTPKKALQFDTKFHYYKDEADQLYCPSCYDDKDKLIHLKPCAEPSYGWECSACKNIVKNPNYCSPLRDVSAPDYHPFSA